MIEMIGIVYLLKGRKKRIAPPHPKKEKENNSFECFKISNLSAFVVHCTSRTKKCR
jgi:hypothetical protein